MSPRRPPDRAAWSIVLELAPDRSVRAGSKAELAAAIGRGADLRVYTEFLFEEHIVPGGNGDPSLDGLIREVIDFRETILVEGRHVGGITTQRQPLEPPFGFNGTEAKMSFFMYTGDGDQRLANLVFAGVDAAPSPGERSVTAPPADMPKMGVQEFFDVGTSGPSRNFVYDMETYRFFVRDDWEELLATAADGTTTFGSFDALEAAQVGGREIKVGIRDLAAELGSPDGDAVSHEVFTPVGSGFLHVRPRIYATLTHPVVRVAPGEPLHYASSNWDVAWVFVRSDGLATVRRLDPYTRRWEDRPAPIRLPLVCTLGSGVIPSPERQAEVLASMPNAIVATIRPDGVPQLTPNWYLWTGETFLISVAGNSVKTRHLRRDPRIVLCIDDVEGGDYVQVTGSAILVEGDAAREPTLALCRKYMPAEQVLPHWESLLAEGPRVVIEVRPARFQWHDR